MNAIKNMECVRNGSCSLKEQSIIAMNSFVLSALERVRQSGNAEKYEAAKKQVEELNKKAESLPDSFFESIDCEWNNEGKPIFAAVLSA